MPSNGFDPAVLKALLAEIDDGDDRLASLKGSYMAECRPVREDIAGVFASAKDKGLGVKAFRIIVANHRLDRAKKRNESKLDIDQLAEFRQMHEALGGLADLPLGAHALERARPQEQSLNSL